MSQSTVIPNEARNLSSSSMSTAPSLSHWRFVHNLVILSARSFRDAKDLNRRAWHVFSPMTTSEYATPAENKFSSSDVAAILREQNWHTSELTPEQSTWCEHAATLLGPQSADRPAFENLLKLIFHYDWQEILSQVDSHATLSRYAARDALRQLASLLLDPAPLTSDRFHEVIDAMKANLDIRGRELFQTVRLSLAGRSGEGDLDRVILLLDEAAAANFATPVKSARNRIIEFCAALD